MAKPQTSPGTAAATTLPALYPNPRTGSITRKGHLYPPGRDFLANSSSNKMQPGVLEIRRHIPAREQTLRCKKPHLQQDVFGEWKRHSVPCLECSARASATPVETQRAQPIRKCAPIAP